jgi:hypothetical protein
MLVVDLLSKLGVDLRLKLRVDELSDMLRPVELVVRLPNVRRGPLKLTGDIPCISLVLRDV